MRSARISGLLGLAALAIIASPCAMAQDPGWYVGADLGRSRARIDDARIASGLLDGGFNTTGMDDRKHDTGFKVYTGYQFSRFFAVEGGYFELGKFGFRADTVPAGSLDGNISLRGLNIDAVGILPFTAKFSGFARAGVTYVEAKDAFGGTGLVVVTEPYAHSGHAEYKFGAGLEYDFTRKVGMRAELERYRVNDAIGNRGDVDMASVGLLYRFGRKAPASAPAPAPAPAAAAYVAPAPGPALAPMMVVVPVASATQEYCTILDLQFDIDRNEILREDKEKLAVVGTYMAKYPGTTAVIEGHADNVGSEDHNLKLSQQRAQAVVDYLVGSLHIDASRLTAVGYGDTRPVADNSTEEGKRRNRRIDAVIACVTDVEGLTVAPARVTMALAIDYDKNRAEIKPEYDRELGKVARFLKANPTVTATVEGHTGNLQGTRELAFEISQRRAQNVVDYLVAKYGIDRSRLGIQAYGDTRRFAYNTSAEGQLENRRVNIIINYPK